MKFGAEMKGSLPMHYKAFPGDFENDSADTEHKITELVDHEQSEMFDSDVDLGVAPTERSEFTPPPTPESNGSWSNYGDNITDLREVWGEEIPQVDSPQLDLPGILEGKATADSSEPKVIDWREPTERVRPTGTEEVTPQVEDVSKIPNINMSASSGETSTRRESVLQPDRLKNLASIFGSKGREFLQNMPEKAQQIASSMYEGIYKIPGVNRLVAKAEIAWNQGWIDRKQDKVIELNDKVREISAESAILGESEAALNDALETIRSAGFGSTAKIEKSLRQIASRKSELSEKKTTFETKVTRKQESMGSFIEKRNEITDRMVDKYTERSKPLEAKMENLGGLQDALEFQTAIMEADHAEKMIEINKLDEKRARVYDSLRSAGQLDKNGNHPALRQFDAVINASKIKIANAEAVVKAKERDIKERIKSAADKAKIYKDKGAEFSAIKNRALYAPESSSAAPEEALEDSSISSGFAEEEHLAENSRLSIGTFLDKWNEHLNDITDAKQRESLAIDKDAFLKGARWNDSKELDYEHFIKVLDGYYRMKKVDFRDKDKISDSFRGAKIDKE